MKKIFIRSCMAIGGIALLLLSAFAALILFLSVTEFKPDDTMDVSMNHPVEQKITVDTDISLMTWNIGNAVLGDNADFFMDGGKHVKTSTKERMKKNLTGITDYIQSEKPDIVFFQELDIDSARSYRTDQERYLADSLTQYTESFAKNYSCEFVPFPFPPLGKMESGISTFSRFSVTHAQRKSLPVPFSWPVRLANLKRCLLISRLPVENSEHDLVLVNLHLEAYDQGEGKAAQTDMLRTILEEERKKGNYVIAGGDFNQTFSASANPMFPEIDGVWHAGTIENSDFSEQWQLLMDEDTPSCRSLDRPFVGEDRDGFQFYQIDGLIVSDNIQVSEYHVDDLNFVCSDHNPLLMKFRLKK